MEEKKLPFDRIYVLHMAENKERYENIMKELSKLQIENEVEIWWTCNKPINNIIGKFILSLRTSYYSGIRQIKPNVYGNVFDCAYNHYSIIKQSYLRGFNSILILEDDVIFKKNLAEFKKIINAIPKDFKIVKLASSAIENNVQNCNEVFIDKNHTDWDRYKFGATCYALSRSGMEILIKEYEKKFTVSDIVINNVFANALLNDDCYCLAANDLISAHNGQKSDIVDN